MFSNTFGRYLAAVKDYITAWRRLQPWPACRNMLLQELSEETAWLNLLPMVSCAIVGGRPEDAIPATVAWYTLRRSSQIIDALQDQDALPNELSPTEVLNCALALIFSAFEILTAIPEATKASKLVALFGESGFDAAYGFQLSTVSKANEGTLETSLEHYWRMTILKSGSIYRCATVSGAVIAGSSNPAHLHALGQIGYAMGVMLQILDDCRDITDTNVAESVKEIRLPLIALRTTQSVGVDDTPDTEDWLEKIDLQKTAEIISVILLEWQERALANLANLPPSEATTMLKGIVCRITEKT